MDVDIEQAVLTQAACKVLDGLPTDTKKQLLEQSLTKSLGNILSPWDVQRAIKIDVERYMVEYIKDPAVQERIKVATRESMNILMDGVIHAVVIGAQDNLRNTYNQLVKQEKG